MFDKIRLAEIVKQYKKDFVSENWWDDEKFKWEAIKCFQDNWDINAPDFAEMLKKSLEKTDNLLVAANNFPRGMIEEFSDAAPEEVRAMFLSLFDENKDVYERIETFKKQSEVLLKKYKSDDKQHYQNENSISTYLWLRFPDKYFIYKLGEIKSVANELKAEYRFKKGAYSDNIRNCILFYNEINSVIKEDAELVDLLKTNLTESCYSDPELITLTIDIGFYISRVISQKVEESSTSGWYGANYDPGLSKDDWISLIQNASVFTPASLEIMKRIKDYGGTASCTQLAIKYGETSNFYNAGSVNLAKRVVDASGIKPNTREDGSTQWWTVLYLGRNAEKDEEGSFVWKLRPELSSALDTIDMNNVSLFSKNSTQSFWKVSHGPGVISDEEAELFEKKHVIVVNGNTAAKAGGKVTQGYDFVNSMRKGDYFYLCRGNSIRLLGMITTDKPEKNMEKGGDWYQRPYEVIATSKDTSPYSGRDKWWAPNNNSTFIRVKENDIDLLDELILMPYFGLKANNLRQGNDNNVGYWWLNANPRIWSFSDLAVGEEQEYTLYNENGNKRRIFQNFLDAKVGDMVICYESNPVKQIVGIGRVSAEQNGEKIFFEKREGLTSPIDYATLKNSAELDRMEYFQNPQGSLFKLTKGEYDFILDIIREENPLSFDNVLDGYSKTDFLKDVYMTEKRYENLVAVLRNKKNIILQGAPGVGKTFAARRLAWSMMGEKDDSRIEFVQFHQNYSYEDFMMGYKPVEDGFELKYGIFYRFCQKAANQPDKEFFFIIDEINRGNMSKIFGELLMLIENDYRGTKATLAYNGLSFSVPKNLYIIGMMNTADRSLAMIDYALRRRFSFFEVEPGFDSEGFIQYQNGLNNETLNELVNKVKDLNREITLDKSLGKGFCIGHSYFCGRDVCTEEWLHSIVDYDILPMLSEYWFDDANKLQRWENILQGVFQ